MNSGKISIRTIDKNELKDALPLIWNVFSQYEGVNYQDNQKEAFWNAIHSVEYLNRLSSFGAFSDQRLLGVISLRNNRSHIALFFVDSKFQNKGIGKALWNKVVETTDAEEITVHSSIYAKGIYKKLGFIEQGSLKSDGGIKYIPMVYKNMLNKLKAKDTKVSYDYSKEICRLSLLSDKYYTFFDDFQALLNDANSYVRVRGFLLCSSQARWDREGKLKKAFPSLAFLIHDKKPTVVRQCLKALKEVIKYRPELLMDIYNEVQTIDTSIYKESTAPLIKKDIEELARMIEEN